MTEREAERLYKQTAMAEAPDPWNRIESQLDEKEVVEMKTSVFKKIGHFIFGGSTLKTAVSICVICVIGAGVIGQASGRFHGMGKSSSTTMDMASGSGMNSQTSNSYGMVYSNGAMAEEAEADVEAVDEASGEIMEAAGAPTTDSGAVVNGALSADQGTATDEAADGSAGGESAAGIESTRKLIRNLSLDVETLTFDTFLTDLQAQVTALGGYVESSTVSGNSYDYESNRYANMTLRIPNSKTEELLTQIGDEANVTNKSESVDDVTLTYVDIQSHITALETERDQLLALMEKAESVEDLMSIQSELTNVRYQLESYQSQLKTYDNQIDYDTISIYISEVTKTTPAEEPSIWQRMSDGFVDSIKGVGEGIVDFAVWFVACIPYFVVLFIVVFAVIALIKKIRNKKNRKIKSQDE